MSYSLIRSLLFSLPTECAHSLSLHSLDLAHRLGLLSGLYQQPSLPVRAMGIDFPNPVGLAAGLDKNGDHIDALAALGFGFIEIGTVTPRPQPGNPQPRLFRLPEASAIINRMGFNNQGVDYLINKVRQAQFRGVLGINIGKNFDTPIERAADDYLTCLEKVYPWATYVTVNISSPNTRNLRDLQQSDALDGLLLQLKQTQSRLADQYGRYVPLAVKIAPDLTDQQIREVALLLEAHRIDAAIATNTTVSRQGVEHLSLASEAGGLSGLPVRDQATRVLGQLRQALSSEIPIIGVGGIASGQDAADKLKAGATLVQVYTGLIYQGPSLIQSICKTIAGK